MASAADLLSIFNRIATRVSVGVDNYDTVHKLITRRAEAADKIAEILKALIPSNLDESDPIEMYLIDHIKTESDLHAGLAAELRKAILNPVKPYEKSMKEKQKLFEKSIKGPIKELSSACSAVEKIQQDITSEQAKLTTIQPAKRDSQQKKIHKLIQEQNTRKTNAEALSNKFQSQVVPGIHKDFKEFDNSRLNRMQKSAFTCAELLNQTNEEIKKINYVLGRKMSVFDATDRSDRFIIKAFDPGAHIADQEEEIIAVAINDYRSEEPSDLQFVRGDRIRVLLQHSSGWWDGELNGQKGTFPKTFVEIIGRAEVKNDPIGAVFLVIKDHEVVRGGDIPLLSGDLVYVDFVSKERCSGWNLRTGQKGNFPLSKLEQRL